MSVVITSGPNKAEQKRKRGKALAALRQMFPQVSRTCWSWYDKEERETHTHETTNQPKDVLFVVQMAKNANYNAEAAADVLFAMQEGDPERKREKGRERRDRDRMSWTGHTAGNKSRRTGQKSGRGTGNNCNSGRWKQNRKTPYVCCDISLKFANLGKFAFLPFVCILQPTSDDNGFVADSFYSLVHEMFCGQLDKEWLWILVFFLLVFITLKRHLEMWPLCV